MIELLLIFIVVMMLFGPARVRGTLGNFFRNRIGNPFRLPCPSCRELINDRAKECPHCHTAVDFRPAWRRLDLNNRNRWAR
jgi:hypothetical protein